MDLRDKAGFTFAMYSLKAVSREWSRARESWSPSIPAVTAILWQALRKSFDVRRRPSVFRRMIKVVLVSSTNISGEKS